MNQRRETESFTFTHEGFPIGSALHQLLNATRIEVRSQEGQQQTAFESQSRRGSGSHHQFPAIGQFAGCSYSSKQFVLFPFKCNDSRTDVAHSMTEDYLD